MYDAPNAAPLALKGGEVEFDGVSFGYEPGRMVLKDVSRGENLFCVCARVSCVLRTLSLQSSC